MLIVILKQDKTTNRKLNIVREGLNFYLVGVKYKTLPFAINRLGVSKSPVM